MPAWRASSGFDRVAVLSHRSTGRLAVIGLWHGDLPPIDARSLESLNEHLDQARVDAWFSVEISTGHIEGDAGRIVSAAVQPGSGENVIARFQNVIMHAATAQSGFRGGLLLMHEDRRQVVSIGLWNSHAELIESERTGYFGRQLPRLSRFLDGPPSNVHYDTIIAM
ncbi:MAG TPA: hypothetical protein VMM78_09085 [Thermomicrobiales bacterium]|nr:hypothetical protein [Thermomicrobiales bacterium]